MFRPSRALRVQRVVTVVAMPDTQSIERINALQATAGRDLNGRNGGVRGVDKGDPTVSFNGPVAFAPNPATAANAVTVPASSVPIGPATWSTSAQVDPDLAPYRANLLARMSR